MIHNQILIPRRRSIRPVTYDVFRQMSPSLYHCCLLRWTACMMFPEVFYMDCTAGTSKQRRTLFVMAINDSEGMSIKFAAENSLSRKTEDKWKMDWCDRHKRLSLFTWKTNILERKCKSRAKNIRFYHQPKLKQNVQQFWLTDTRLDIELDTATNSSTSSTWAPSWSLYHWGIPAWALCTPLTSSYSGSQLALVAKLLTKLVGT